MTIVPFLHKVNALILNPILLLLFSLSFVYFFYGIVRFLRVDDSAASERKEARDAIMWGMVGMLIMFSVYGIIYFVLKSFGIDANDIKSPGALEFLNWR